MSNLSEPLYAKQGIWASAPRLWEWWQSVRKATRPRVSPHLIGAGFLAGISGSWAMLGSMARASGGEGLPAWWGMAGTIGLLLSLGYMAWAWVRQRRGGQVDAYFSALELRRWRDLIANRGVARLIPVVERLDRAASAYLELITLSQTGPWAATDGGSSTSLAELFEPAGEIMNHLAGLAVLGPGLEDDPERLAQLLDNMDVAVASLTETVEPLRDLVMRSRSESAVDLAPLRRRLQEVKARVEAEAELAQLSKQVPR